MWKSYKKFEMMMLTAMHSCQKWIIWKIPIRTHLWPKKKKLKTCQDVEAGSWLSESTQTSLGLHFQLSTKMWMVDFFLMRKHCFHVYWSITFLQKNLSQQKAGRGLLAHVFLSLNVLLSAPALDLKSLRVVMVWTRQHSTLYTEVLQNVICSM